MLMDERRLRNNRRSPGRAARGVCETLNSEKLLWLVPVSSPLLSPGRERATLVRKNLKQRSIFAFPHNLKLSIDTEEPSSPKVSCIGQVKTGRKSCGSATDSKTGKRHQHACSKQFKWASLFSLSRGAHCPPCDGSEVSRFGLPSCGSSFSCNPERSCGALFAKSLILLQECGDKNLSKSVVQNITCKDGKENQSKLHVPWEQSACRHGDLAKDVNGSGVSSLNMVARNACDMETHDSPLTKGIKEITSGAEKNDPSTLSLVAHQQERLSIRVAMEKDGECLDADSALHLNVTCESEIGSSGDGYLCTVNKPVDDTACKFDMTVVDGEERVRSNIEEVSFKAAIQNWSGCDENQCEEFKEYNVNDKHAHRALDGIDRQKWQGRHFYEDTERKTKLFNFNAVDCAVSSIPSFPQLSERDLHCFVIGKDMGSVWDIHMAKKSDACSAQAAFIFLDCSLFGNLSKRDTRDGFASSQLWAVSFHDSRGEAKLFRSHSATSYRTVIGLQRCKSEPRKPY